MFVRVTLRWPVVWLLLFWIYCFFIVCFIFISPVTFLSFSSVARTMSFILGLLFYSPGMIPGRRPRNVIFGIGPLSWLGLGPRGNENGRRRPVRGGRGTKSYVTTQRRARTETQTTEAEPRKQITRHPTCRNSLAQHSQTPNGICCICCAALYL